MLLSDDDWAIAVDDNDVMWSEWTRSSLTKEAEIEIP
jgi:hypothetical protein